MLRRSPRAAMLWCAALVVAVVTALWVGGTLASLHRQDTRYGRVVAFAVARRDLPVGRVVADTDLSMAHARGGARPSGALDASTALGRVLVVAVLRGQAVTARHLAAKGRDGHDGVVAPGHRAMRVTVADTPRLRVGDHVDVYVTFDPGQVAADTDPTRTVADAVPVLALDRRDDRAGAESTTGVTLMVDVDEALRLAYSGANGVLALALVPPEEVHDPTASRGTRTLPSR
ncbi:MAG: Flp pilus assembly protein CpaB [Acidimicrobiia bacterium]